jgi:hypothetical protein
MSGVSPTQRTLKALKEEGYRCGIVERFVGPLNIRVDLFHIIDIIAIRPGEVLSMDSGEVRPGEIVGVQSCGSAYSEHYRKLTEEHADASRDWIAAGGRLELWGWRKVKVKRGGKAMVWAPRRAEITYNDLRAQGQDPPSAPRTGQGDSDQARDHDSLESDRLW